MISIYIQSKNSTSKILLNSCYNGSNYNFVELNYIYQILFIDISVVKIRKVDGE